MLKYLAAICTILVLFPAVAQAENSDPFSQATIGGMSRFTSPVRAKIPARASDALGGASEINCPRGAAPATCIPMSVWNATFKTGDLTPAAIATTTGKQIAPNASLATATPWLSRVTIASALAANPTMANLPLTTADGTRTTLGKLGAGNRILGQVVDLRQTTISQFPQIQNIQLKRFPSLAKLPANVVPGLPQIKIANMPGFRMPAGIALMKLDLIRTKERNIQHMVMSGSNQQPNAKCDRNCDYGEFHPWVGMPYLRGAKIISGDSLSVRGGEGLLAMVNGGMEPTGVEANIGSGGIKFVLRNLNPRNGSATVAINLRFCGWLVGCTPYFIGIPLFPISERNNWFPIVATNASVYRRLRN